jgi:hypothetical protein
MVMVLALIVSLKQGDNFITLYLNVVANQELENMPKIPTSVPTMIPLHNSQMSCVIVATRKDIMPTVALPILAQVEADVVDVEEVVVAVDEVAIIISGFLMRTPHKMLLRQHPQKP